MAGAPASMVKRVKLHEKEEGLLLQVPKAIAEWAPLDYQVSLPAPTCPVHDYYSEIPHSVKVMLQSRKWHYCPAHPIVHFG